MKKAILNFLSVCFLILSINAVCFADGVTFGWIQNYIKSSAPDISQMNELTALRTPDGKAASDITASNLIHKLYQVKNDGDLERNMFKNYSGDFSSELDDSANMWQIPEIDSGNVIGEYGYTQGDKSLLKDNYTAVNNGVGFGIIYDEDKLSQILNSGNIGVPAEIKSVYITFPSTAIFMYVKTNSGEYIVPTRDITLSFYKNNKYTSENKFKALTVYKADELVSAYKTALEDRVRYEKELDKKDNTHNSQYVDKNGEVIDATPSPTVLPQATPSPKITPSPKPDTSPAPTAQHDEVPSPDEKKLTVNGSDMSISVDGKAVDFPDAKPFVDDNYHTQVPVRAVAEMLDCDIDWDKDSETVTITNENNVVALVIGSDIMTVNGGEVKMDTAALIKDDRTYIPVRFVAEVLGLKVEWI